MRKIIGLVALVTALSFSTNAGAEDLPFGVQLDLVLGMDIPTSREDLSVPIMVEFFYNQSSGDIMPFLMGGVGWNPVRWYRMDGIVGLVGNFPTDRTSFMVTWGNRFSLWEGEIVLVANLNLVVARDSVTYFGVYSVDWAGDEEINIGFRAEQIDELVTFGPRVGVTIEEFHFEVQYRYGAQEENQGHALRLVIGLGY